MSDLRTIQSEFPILQHFQSQGVVYLDNAATSQQSRSSLNAQKRYVTTQHAGVRRGVSSLSTEAGRAIESARASVASFMHANDAQEIVFSKNATEALNLVAFGYAMQILGEGDEILISKLEHHANLIPWQIVAKRTGATLQFIPINEHGELDQSALGKLVSARTKIIAITHVSNVFGNTVPIEKVTEMAHRVGAVVVIDGAQAVAHQPVDVTSLGADFYAFSGHKMYAPPGVGVLFGRAQLLAQMEPLIYGGAMIEHVSYQSATWDAPPHRFEGGTLNAPAILGLKAAIELLQSLAWSEIQRHERELIAQLRHGLQKIDDVVLYGPGDADEYASLVSCNMTGIHHHDVGQLLDDAGVIVRVGHHCAEPLMSELGISGTVRLSVGIYNTTADIEAAIAAMRQVKKRVGHDRN